MFGVLKECCEQFMKSFDKIAEAETCIEMKEIFARYTTNIIMSAAFGIKVNCVEEPNNEVRYWGRRIFEYSSIWNAIFVFAPQIADLFSVPLTDRGTTNFFINMFRNTVQYRRTHNVVRHDFMNLLIQLMENGYIEPDKKENAADVSLTSATNKFSMLEAAAQAYVFFIGGFETSSTTATFCLYELALHQDIQNKLCQEIDEIMEKHGELTYNALNNAMIYLQKVVNETLRKYPPLPVLNRICTEAIDLSTTIHVPKGTLITIPVLGIHRDPAIYPDPDRFDPERFTADQITTRHSYAYLAFGEGPRGCIAQRFGLLQVKVSILSILLKFKVKLHPRTPVPLIMEEAPVILTAKGGVHFIIEPRENRFLD